MSRRRSATTRRTTAGSSRPWERASTQLDGTRSAAHRPRPLRSVGPQGMTHVSNLRLTARLAPAALPPALHERPAGDTIDGVGPTIEFRLFERKVGPPADGTDARPQSPLATPNGTKIVLVGRVALEQILDLRRQPRGRFRSAARTIWGSPAIADSKGHGIRWGVRRRELARERPPPVFDAQHTEHFISSTQERKCGGQSQHMRWIGRGHR